MKNGNNQRKQLKKVTIMKLVLHITPGSISRHWLIAIMALLFVLPNAQAEGLRKVAPTAADAPVMLETGRPDFGNFAVYDGPETGRLYFEIGDVNEKFFLGLSPEYNDDGDPMSGTFQGQYVFRIRFDNEIEGSPNPVVHGPFTVTNTNANVGDWTQSLFGNYPVGTMQNGALMYQFQPAQTGKYYVEFTDTSFPDETGSKVNIPFWDFTVANNGIPIDGRVWSKNWAFRTPQRDPVTTPDCVWNREFNGTLYSYTTDGFVSRIDFQDAGMQGLSFNITFNKTGPGTSGVLTEDRKSIPGVNATANAAEHQVFLSEPDIALFPSGECGELTPPDAFRCVDETTFCLDVSVTSPGQVEIILDFNQNGQFDTNSVDVLLLYEFPEDGPLSGCVPWNGLQGDGVPAQLGDTIELVFTYSQGIQHWSAYDVEYMRNGYCIETIRPNCEPNLSSNFLYWNDTNIPQDPGTGAVKDGRNGYQCEQNRRNWDNFNINAPDCESFNDNATTGYGDKNTINTWWFANTSTKTQLSIPLVAGIVEGPDSICIGEVAVFEANNISAAGTVTFSWTGPNGFTANTASITVSDAGEYCVDIVDDLGCSTNICKTLTVIDPNDGSLVYPTLLSACLGSMVEIIPTGDLTGYTFLWSPTVGLDDPTSPSPSLTFVGNTTRTVTITNIVTGCSFEQTVAINGLIEPTPNFTTNVGCEQGLTINFTNTSTDGATYLWDFGDLTSTTDVSADENPSYTYPGPGTYSVSLTVTSNDGCVATITQQVVVVDIPLNANFTVSYNDCTNDAVEVQFTNTSINGANNTVSYSWTFSNGNGTSDQENPTLTLTSNQTFTALLTIQTADGCLASATQEVTVALGPPADQFPDILLICNGDSEQITPGGDPSFTYQWSPATGINDVTSPQPTFNPLVSTTYTVTVTASGADDCVIVETVEVTIPPVIGLEVNGGGAFCAPSTVLTATADVPATIEWFLGSDLVFTGDTFTADILGTTTYTVIATDASGCTESEEVTVTLTLLPPADQFPDLLLVCNGDSVQITPGGDPSYTYQWSPATGISDPGSPQPFFNPTTSTTYTVTVTTSGPEICSVVETVEVTVPPVIDLEVSGGGAFCTGTTVLSATTAVATTIQWFLDDVLVATGDTFTPALSGTTTYTVLATDANECTESVEVTVSGGPVDVSVPDTLAVCLGEEILLSVTNLDPNDDLTYLWSPVEAFVPGTETSATPDYIETVGQQDVSVLVANQFGCTIEESVHIAVVDPDIELSFTSQIDCDGGTVTFTNTSTDAFGYVWDFGDGSGPNFEENPVHVYDAPGTYTVTLDIIYEVNCAEAFSMQIVVEEPQIFAGFEYDIVGCSANAAIIQFTDATVNTLNNTNSWTWTFLDAVPATSAEQNPLVTVSTEGPLTVTLTIGTTNGCNSSITEILEIDLVDLDISLTDTLFVCLGDNVQLNPDGDPSLTYSWTPVTGLDDPTAASPIATPLATTTYLANAYSTVGTDTCFVMDSVVVFVPEAIDLQLDQEPVVVTCGETVTINATANVEIDVQWCSTIDGVIGTGSSISINPFRTDTIIAKATDEFGCMAMDTIIVVDNGVDIEIEGDGDLTACEGVITTLTVNNLDDQDVLTYAWDPEANIVGPTDGSSVDIIVDEAGTIVFTAIVTNQFACVDTVTFTVDVLEFQAEVADTVFTCYNEPTPLNPGGNPTYIYTWSPTTGLDLSNPENPIATLTENQTYQVTITDPITGCSSDPDSIVVIVYPEIGLQTEGGTQICEAEPVTLTATTAIATQIIWYLNGDSIGMGNTITVTPPNEDGCFTYTAIATDLETGCEESSSQEICLQIFTEELPTEDVTVCANEPTPINPGGDPTLIYTWTPEDEFIDLTEPWNPVVTTGMPLTYFVTVLDTTFGCSVTDTVNIDISPEINLEISPETVVLCESSEVTLTANTDNDPANVSWFLLPGNDLLGMGTTVTFTPPLGASEVYAVAMSEAGCTENDTIAINNFPLDVDITDTLVICEPTATVELSVINNDPTQVITVAWEAEGVLTALDELTVTVDPNVTNDFSVTVTNQFGCTTVLNTSVTVIDLMSDLTISVDQDTVLFGESVTITVDGCIGCTYDWDPPAEDSPVIVVTPDFLLPDSNEYFVTVNQLGCEQDLMISVFVIDGTCDVDRVFLPNAFTPNNDGDNDILRLRSQFLDELSEVEWLIYNRWGEEMFRTQNQYDVWDGTYRGEALPPDVYGFYLKVLCPGGEELIQKGNITILR